MEEIKQKDNTNCITTTEFQKKLFNLVMDAIAPWVLSDDEENPELRRKNWRICEISQKEEQVILCLTHVNGFEQYTALICCLGEPEVVAVSYSDGTLGMLNPYLDGGGKLGSDLDGPGCWNVLSVTFCAEFGAETVRFVRKGVVEEVSVNPFGAISIIDWGSNDPIDEYVGIKVNGQWQSPVVGAVPFTTNFLTNGWCEAVSQGKEKRLRWKRWITAAFAELCGSDRAVLQREMMNTFAGDCCKMNCYREFKNERREFLKQEKMPLMDLTPTI